MSQKITTTFRDKNLVNDVDTADIATGQMLIIGTIKHRTGRIRQLSDHGVSAGPSPACPLALQTRLHIFNFGISSYGKIPENQILVGREGIEPSTNRLCVPLQLSLPLSSLWSGLSLYPPLCGYLPYSLYTFPALSERAGFGSGLPFIGFPEFDRIYLPVTLVSSP